MSLEELLNLAQTDVTEALKEAFCIGNHFECTWEEFSAYMDGAKDAFKIVKGEK